MDLQTFLDNAVRNARAKKLATSDQYTLGKLISMIEEILTISDRDEPPTVCYDFGYMFPTSIDSWRGSYAELALNYTEGGDEMKAPDFLKLLKEANGKTYEGYKGGDFKMDLSTPVWVANYGQAGSTAIVGVIDHGYKIILVTGFREF